MPNLPRHSLANVAVGDSAVIRFVLFDLVRAHLESLGLVGGERVTCVGGDAATIRFQGERGNDLPVDRFFARFVAVDPCVDGRSRVPATTGGARASLPRRSAHAVT